MHRVLGLGSDWIYFKIYSGYKIADNILIDYLNEKMEFLESENYIKKWFFIRYNDSDSHLRIRFQVNKRDDVYQIMTKLNPVFEDLLQKNFIWKVQTDTYLREIERYGLSTIEDSETLFYFDSKMITAYLNLKNTFEKEETQLLFSFLSIDSFLNAFSLSSSKKLELLNNLQQSFKQEFNATKVLKSELDKHYRTLENEIERELSSVSNSKFSMLHEIIHEKHIQIQPVVASIKVKLEINLNSFLSSHIHMMINRQFTSRQREYEALIYDHLYRYYKMCCFKNKVFLKVNPLHSLPTLA
jgi:thiopeptide-type bacteriocin biosynthesis protein